MGEEFDGGVDENAESEVGRCVVVPVVHPVLGSLVRVPDNNPKKDQINQRRPVLNDHPEHLQVNPLPELLKDLALTRFSLLTKFWGDKEEICVPEEVDDHDKGEDTEEEEHQGHVLQVEGHSAMLVLVSEITIPQKLLPYVCLIVRMTVNDSS